MSEAINSLIQTLSRNDIACISAIEGRTLTTISCGGAIDCLIRPENIDQIKNVFIQLKDHDLLSTSRSLGFGSNILIADQGINDPIVQLGKGFRYFSIKENGHHNTVSIVAGGAMSLTALSREASSLGLSGLEFAGGIPASIGGAVAMNAGAHGSDVAAVLESVFCFLTETGTFETIAAKDIIFSYRKTLLPPQTIVLEATFQLVRSEKEKVQQLLQHNLTERRKHQPLTFPSCGSVFKNPEAERGSAGALIESVGLKGKRSGDIEISSMHANWIVNPTKKGMAQDVFTLIQLAKNTVLEKCQIELVPEVKLWGW